MKTVKKWTRWMLIGLAMTCLMAASISAQKKNAGMAGHEEPKQDVKSAGKKTVRGGDGILAVLDEQVAAWNAGDLEKFMRGYWRSPELTFFSSSGKLNGWEATIERYRRTYQAEGREMGKLVFDDLDITMLGVDAALVRGRWKLDFPDGKQIGGIYSLVFKRFRNEWKIVHDHTSTVP